MAAHVPIATGGALAIIARCRCSGFVAHHVLTGPPRRLAWHIAAATLNS
jgi:hypothetical protein